MSATATLAIITSSLAVAKQVYELGIEVLPNAKTFMMNLLTLIDSYVNGTEISDESLKAMQDETDAMSAACHAAYLEKYGD